MSYNFPGLINPKRTAGRSSAVASSAFTPCAVTPARPDECRKILGRELSALQVYERETSETRNGPRRTRKNQESFPDELFLYPLGKYMPTSGSTPDGRIHYPDGQMVLPCGFEPQPSEPESEILSIRLREQGLRKYEKSGEKGSRVGNNLDFWLHFGKFATS